MQVILTLEPRPVNGRQSENRMGNSDDLKKTIRFNKLLGMWAAEKLRLTGRHATPIRTPSLWAPSIPSAATCSAKFARTSTPRGRGPTGRADPTRNERAHAPSREPNASNARRYPRCRSGNAHAQSLSRDDGAFTPPWGGRQSERVQSQHPSAPSDHLPPRDRPPGKKPPIAAS